MSVAVFEEKARALAGLAKGAEVYVEGRLSLNAWTGKDGQQRTGLSWEGDAARPTNPPCLAARLWSGRGQVSTK